MNFHEARNLEGQNNAKGYQQGVSMIGTVQALIDPQRIFTTNKKPTQRIQLLDAQGETCKVKVFLGNGPDILPSDVGTLQQFTDLAMNKYKGNITYMAFWDNMHPPQGQSTHLNAATQAIIDKHLRPEQAAEEIQDHMAGPITPTDPSTKYPDQPIPPARTPINQTYTPPPQPTQQDYEAKEREKVIGMCMCGHVNARLVHTPATELLEDKAQFAALWQIATRIVDGTGQVTDGPNF